MRKLWFALSLALLGSVLTLIMGLLSDVRLLALFYRFCVSFIILGLCGYVIAVIVEKFVVMDTQELKTKGQNIDIISEQQQPSENDQEDSFIPLTPDSLEHISLPKD